MVADRVVWNEGNCGVIFCVPNDEQGSYHFRIVNGKMTFYALFNFFLLCDFFCLTTGRLVFTEEPQPVASYTGETILLSCGACSSSPARYSWVRDGVVLSGGEPWRNKSGSSLRVEITEPTSIYQCVVNTSDWEIESAPAKVQSLGSTYFSLSLSLCLSLSLSLLFSLSLSLSLSLFSPLSLSSLSLLSLSPLSLSKIYISLSLSLLSLRTCVCVCTCCTCVCVCVHVGARVHAYGCVQ